MQQAPPEPQPASRPWRKVLGIAAVAAGIVLLVLERGFFRGAGDGGSCFWIAVAGLLIILGVVELLDRGQKPPPADL